MSTGSEPDPFAAVARLEGVGQAAGHARAAVDALLRHPAMRRRSGALAAASATAGARASALLEGAPVTETGAPDPDDPRWQGALRALVELPALARTWDRAPLQVLARLHVLAAADLAPAGELGRPRPEADTARLEQLVRLATGPTAAPGVVVAALVHGELVAIAPFGTADGIVARAAERLVLLVTGVDPKAVSVPEVGHLARSAAFATALAGYTGGQRRGVAGWVRHCADAYAGGAEEGLRLAAGLP